MRHSARGTTKEGGVYMERRRGRSKALFGRRMLVQVIGRAQTRGWATWQRAAGFWHASGPFTRTE